MDEGRIRISPLFTNSQYAQSLSRDYVPFLDLHILSKDYAGLNTITSPAGSMYFMDYVYPSQNIQFSNLYNSDYWQTLNITELDQNGLPAETWKIYAPLISDVKFDRLDYSNENIVTITATINYDWAKLVPRTTKESMTIS